MAESKQEEIVSGLMEDWAAGLARVLEAMTGEKAQVIRRPAGSESAPTDSVLWWEQPLSLGPGATLWVGTPDQAWLGIGGLTLRAAGIEETDAASAKSTYLEILSQSLSALAQAVGKRVGREVASESGHEVGSLPEGLSLLEATVSVGASSLPPLRVSFSGPLLSKMEAGQAAPVRWEPAEVVTPPEEAPKAAAPAKTMDLLLEVELPVSVSFGRAELPLKDVLRLTTGSIVELNRAVSEPVEVIVNNCVIARGEVVVVEGNYGVRIKEILSQQERMKTLR